MAPCAKLAHANAQSSVETGLMSRDTLPGKPVGRTAETASPDALGPVEDESTGAVGKADERREVGNVIASVVVKETGKVLKCSFFDAEILSPRAGALRHLWQNAPLHQPGKRVRAAFVKCAAQKALDEPAG
jgi:hypothetical protein